MDDLEYSVSYSDLARKIKSHAEQAARLTVEALAQDLANICLQENSAEKVIVRVEKPEAVKLPDQSDRNRTRKGLNGQPPQERLIFI
jgi:FolB domain-containing protein